MTHALCFACGDIKFGALCPCKSCGRGPTGNLELDIFFTDYYFTRDTLERFGGVLKRINTALPIPEVIGDATASDEVRGRRLLAFVQFISDSHADLMRAELTTEKARAARDVLARIEVSAVRVEFSEKAKKIRAAGGTEEADFRAQQTANEKLAALRQAVGKLSEPRATASEEGEAPETVELTVTTPDGRHLHLVGDAASQTYAILVANGDDTAVELPHIEFAVRHLREQGHSPKFILTPAGAIYQVSGLSMLPVLVVAAVAILAAVVLVLLLIFNPQ